MTSGIIDESAIAEALRLDEPGEGIKRLLRLQGLGLWHGDLSEMRGDVPRSPSAEPTPASAEAEEMTRRIRMVKRLRAALDRLPPEGREALYLRYFLTLPIEEIAGRLGVTTPSVVQRLREALRRVEAMYSETSGDRDEL
jgi:RNA polymerase sigma factor (sigma-70 family)